MADNLNPGDVVQLKSGGPLMTVEVVTPFNGVMCARCAWFDKNKNEHGVFALEMLAKDDGNVGL